MPNRKPKQQKSADDVTIPDGQCMQDFCRQSDSGEYCVEPQGTMFRQKIRNIQAVAQSHGWLSGEDLLGINRTWGYVWRTIPWGKVQDCIDLYTRFAGDEKYKIFDPVLYAGIQSERAKMAGREIKLGEILANTTRDLGKVFF